MVPINHQLEKGSVIPNPTAILHTTIVALGMAINVLGVHLLASLILKENILQISLNTLKRLGFIRLTSIMIRRMHMGEIEELVPSLVVSSKDIESLSLIGNVK